MDTNTQVVSDNLQAQEVAKAERLSLAVKLADEGLADATRIQEKQYSASVSISEFARDILRERAKELQGQEGLIRDYLSGFRKGFTKSGDQRASEAGVLIRAYSKSPELVDAFKGGYQDLIVTCRDIVGRKPQGQRAGNPKAPNDKGMAIINDRISVMKPDQAAQVANKAVAQIVATTPKDWELVLLRQMEAICNQLAKSKQPIFQQAAKDIADFCTSALDDAAIENAAEQATTHKTPGMAEYAAGAEGQQQHAA